MGIERVEIKDFLVFRGEFTTDFCDGINILIGGNGTGKTTLLKAMYGCLKLSENNKTSVVSIGNIFSTDERILFNGGYIYTKYSNNDYVILDFNNKTFNHSDKTKLSSIFIPADEMLSHSKGFLALNNERKLPYDLTSIDILSKAELPETNEITINANIIIDSIKKLIDREVIYENDTFYSVNNTGNKIPFSLEASGFKKLGLLWKLLRNGLLESGTVLIWDEPENSLNPELIPKLVDILLELSRNGVQIFIATYSEILASYFNVNRISNDKVLFTSLFKDEENGQIKANTSERFDLLEPNSLTAEPVKLYEKEIEKGLG